MEIILALSLAIIGYLFISTKSKTLRVFNSKYSKYVGYILVVLLLVFYFKDDIIPKFSDSQETTPQDVAQESLPDNEQTTEQKKIEFAFDVLNALNLYYVTTQSDISEDSSYVEMMASLLDSNNYLEQGSSRISKYMNDPNEYISVTALGMDTGAKAIIKANNDMVLYIRNTDLDDPANFSEAEYQIANWLSAQKEGYKTIATSAPWMAPLMYEFAESDNPSGKIPYTISEEGRQRILNEIEKLFGDDLRLYQLAEESGAESYNTILFAVDAIYNQLAPDTYEEGSLLDQR